MGNFVPRFPLVRNYEFKKNVLTVREILVPVESQIEPEAARRGPLPRLVRKSGPVLRLDK